VFADRNFATSALMTFVLGMALYGMVYILPVFLGQVRGMNSSQIGSIMMVQGGAMFLAAPFVGAVLSRFDPRKTIFLGMMLGAWGVWMDASLTSQSDYDDLFVSQIIRGVGMMMCLVVMSQLAMATLPLSRIKSASGVYNLTRNMGGAIGLALINTLLDQRMAVHLTSIASQITPNRPEVIDHINGMVQRLSGSMGDAAYQGMLVQLSRAVHVQALTLSFNDLLRGLSILMAVMAFLVFTLKRPPSLSGGGAAH
jgi:DHA2 family multidrug resistance protein